MKKVGILFGQEDTFPQALIDRVNSQEDRRRGRAEAVRIDKLIQGEPSGYDVIIDRISQDVPFYRGYLKNAALNGTAVVNNPFWWSADEKFFNNCLATKIGVAVPKTVLLPSKEHPPDTSGKSFRNLAYPLDWEAIFDYIGFPAFFKPFAGGGWKNVYRVTEPGRLLPRLRRDRPARDDAPGGDRLQRVLPLLLRSTARTSTSCSTTRGSRSTCATCATARRSIPALLKKVHDDVLAAEPLARLRLQHGRDGGARRHPLRHRLLQPGAGRRRQLDRRGQLRLDRREGRRHGDPQGDPARRAAATTCAGVSTSAGRPRRRSRRGDAAGRRGDRARRRSRASDATLAARSRSAWPKRSCSRWGSRRSSSSSIRRRATCARTSSTCSTTSSTLADQLKPELHQSVIEVGTNICADIHEARREVTALRSNLSKLARRNGLTIAAAGTHPFAHWKDQLITPDQRYTEIVEDLQQVARANLIFGLHVHVGIEDREVAIHIMNAARYFLPHIFALSTNSPFWQGRNTGLKSLPQQGLRPLPAHRHPGPLRQPLRVRQLHQAAGQDQVHRQRQEDLVGHPDAPVLQHPRVPHLRRADAGRRDDRARGADPGGHRQALQADPAEPRLPPLPRACCSTRTSGAPPATASPAS